nr:cell division protein FtsZ [Chloroflexota bacterium]
ATASPLLEISITGAQGILFNITGGSDLGLFEVNEAAEIIKETADPEANIIFGTVIDERMGDEVMITVIATGFDSSRKREISRAATDVAAGSGYGVRSADGSASGQMFIGNGGARSTSNAGTDAIAADLRADREGRDFLRELDEERAAAEPKFQAADDSGSAGSSERQDRPDAPARSERERTDVMSSRRSTPVPDAEDLDIPAFLRRNR